MSIERDPRAHEFACAVGIDYEIAKLVTKRIPKNFIHTKTNGVKVEKDGDAKVFWILNHIANKKATTRTLEFLTPAEEIDYLKKQGARESLNYLSYTAIHALFLRYRVLEIIGKILPPEIDVINMTNEEVDALVKWLYIVKNEDTIRS